MIIIVMGVSGSGKTTVGKELAQEMGLPFHDADDYHPKANVEKMAAGIPLDDNDRLPWLSALAGLLNVWKMTGGAILACSALKESYRVLLQKEVGEIEWVYLKGTLEEIASRLEARNDHYFNPSLLASQFDTLEEPGYGVQIDISQSPEEIVNELKTIFK